MTEPARLILPWASHRGCPATEFFMLRTVFSGLGVPVLLLGMVFCLGDELIWLQELLQFLLLSRDTGFRNQPWQNSFPGNGIFQNFLGAEQRFVE